jgi:uncharacterized small protein (TIGR04563 family)
MADNTESKKTDQRKQSLYINESVLADMKSQAARLDRSLSYVVKLAWAKGREQIVAMPSVSDDDV